MVSKPNPRPRKTPLERVVPSRAKTAIALLFDGADLAVAAKAAGYPSAARLRDVLKWPQTRRWIAERRTAEIEELCSGNFRAIKDVRDNAANSMARIAAARLAENLRLEVDAPGRQLGQHQPQPGLCIVIENRDGTQINVTPSPQQIEHEPLPGRGYEQAPELER
jgi:hypothetical protein